MERVHRLFTSGSDDEVSNLADYGRLYNWYAVDDARGLCPSGWHVPTDGEFMTLEMELGMSESEANGYRLARHRPRHTDEIVSIRLTVLERHEHERFFRFGWWLPELQWGLLL